jgi:5'-nucleotidase
MALSFTPRSALLSITLSAALLAFSAPSHALKILLANDDGCNFTGINILADALQAAGHSVEIYAPASDQSGQGSRISVPNAGCHAINFGVSRNDLSNTPTSAANRHCVTTSIANCSAPFPPPFTAGEQTVSASPYESTLTGLQLMKGENAPDLVITGINRGENVGATITVSGTVNAAVAAIHNNVPAIAVSLGTPAPDDRYAAAAQFVVRVVDRLQKEAHGAALLPPRTGLNINYPGSGAPKGVLLTQVGTFSTAVAGPYLQADGSLKFGATVDMKPHGTPVGEITEEGVALREGYISISVLDGNLGAPHGQDKEIKARLKSIAP